MAILAAQLTIEDYAKWRSVFDKRKSVREKEGVRSERVYRNPDNPREIIVWLDVADVAKMLEEIGGPESKAAMREAGVVGPPKIHVIS
jgi:hypothetical protein